MLVQLNNFFTKLTPRYKLLIILIIAAVLRFYNLQDKGFILWDEAQYAKYTQFGYSVLHNIDFVIESVNNNNISEEVFKSRLKGSLPFGTPKPGHMVNTTIFSYFFGNYPYSDFFCSAFFGLATVIAIFLLVRNLLNTNYALLAAFFLAISPFNIYYSRLGMAETDASFFLLLSMLFFSNYIYLNKHKSLFIILSGLSCGWFFVCNYRWVYLIPFFLLAILIEGIFQKKTIKYFLFFIISFLSFLVFFQIVYTIGGKLFNVGYSGGYFGMMIDWYSHQMGKSKGIYPHTLYLDILSFLNSYSFMFLLLIGLAVIFKSIKFNSHQSYIYILLFCFVIIPLAIFSFKIRGDKLVAVSVIAPFTIIHSIFGIKYLLSYFKTLTYTKSKIANIFLAIVLVYSILYQMNINKKIISYKSGYSNVNQWLKDENVTKYFATEYAVFNYYSGREANVLKLTNNRQKTKNLVEGGYHYLIMDIHKWYHGPGTPFQFYKEIENELEPVIIFENNAFNFFPYIIDDFHYRHKDEKFMSDLFSDPDNNKIKIYDLRQFYN